MLRIAGCILIAAVCALVGFSMARGYVQKLSDMKTLRRIITEITVMLKGGMTLSEMLYRLRQCEEYIAFDFICVAPDSIDLRKDMIAALKNSDMDDTTKRIISDFIIKLGSTDLDGQLSAADMTLTELDENIKNVGENSAAITKLYRSLGVLTGAFIAILLI